MGRKTPIVAVGCKGQLLSYYRSICEAARMNGLFSSCISRAVKRSTTHRGIRWMKESDYRTLWMEGRTDELAYSIGDIRSQAARKGWMTRTEEQKEKHRESCRKTRLAYLKEHPLNAEAAHRARRKPVMCIQTGETYESAAALARKLGTCSSAVRHAARTGYKVKGLTVKYLK